MGTNPWVTTTVTEVPVLLERDDEKSTPGDGWFRLEEVSSSPNPRVTRSSLERGYYDDPEFSRRHVERGLKELQQNWPGQLLIEDRQSVE